VSARPLPAVPAGDVAAVVATRERLHGLAEDVLAPARVAATGHEIALEPRPGGFGTPPFPGGGEVRVEGVELVRVGADGAEAREPVDADPGAAALLAAWFAFAGELLATLRAEAAPGDDASGVILWPEHFDVAVELGPEGRRATYGGSPGDEQHPLPYLYVAPWADPPGGWDAGGWDAEGFRGAELGYAALAEAGDPRAVGLAFLRGRRDAPAGGPAA
jgi:hypothetical protein